MLGSVQNTLCQVAVYPGTGWEALAPTERDSDACGKRNFQAGVGLRLSKYPTSLFEPCRAPTLIARFPALRVYAVDLHGFAIGESVSENSDSVERARTLEPCGRYRVARAVAYGQVRRVSEARDRMPGNSGIEPDEGERISSPGRYEAILMRPRSDGEQQWNATQGLVV